MTDTYTVEDKETADKKFFAAVESMLFEMSQHHNLGLHDAAACKASGKQSIADITKLFKELNDKIYFGIEPSGEEQAQGRGAAKTFIESPIIIGGGGMRGLKKVGAKILHGLKMMPDIEEPEKDGED